MEMQENVCGSRLFHQTKQEILLFKTRGTNFVGETAGTSLFQYVKFVLEGKLSLSGIA